VIHSLFENGVTNKYFKKKNQDVDCELVVIGSSLNVEGVFLAIR
jgi:hypothetical protein